MSANGIDLVLTCAHHDLAELQSLVDADHERAKQTSNELDDLEKRIAQLGGASAAPEATPLPPQTRRLIVPTSRSWDEIRADSSAQLQARGVALDEIDIDNLLDPAEVARIERRATGGIDRAIHLDQYDLLFAAVAGIAATVVDALVVGIPRDVRWHGQWQEGSWLTGWLRDQGIDSDNWLGRIAKVPFDTMTTVDGHPIPEMSGRNHRVQTFGHDPLIGLALGTLDIMRGTVTGTSSAGVFIHQTGHAPVTNIGEAFVREVLHLFSDLPTRAGLPLPGWSLLTTIRAGNYDGKRVDEWARLMYVRGYDTWHFMSMATVPATVHLVVRAYWAMRRNLDEDYNVDVELETGPTGEQTSGHPHFDALLLAAHTVAAAGNIGKLIAYGGNPLAINFNQWLAFFRAGFKQLQDKGPSVSERIGTRNFANTAALADGWVDLAALDNLPKLPFETPTPAG